MRAWCAHTIRCVAAPLCSTNHIFPCFWQTISLQLSYLFIVTFNRSYATITGLQVLITGWASPVLAGSKTKWSSDADVLLYSKWRCGCIWSRLVYFSCTNRSGNRAKQCDNVFYIVISRSYYRWNIKKNFLLRLRTKKCSDCIPIFTLQSPIGSRSQTHFMGKGPGRAHNANREWHILSSSMGHHI